MDDDTIKLPENFSFLTPCGYSSGSCGYCKDPETSQRSPDSRASLYAISTSLSAEHYQVLMDRGWRRSGRTLYRPDNERSCCPHYTIKLPVQSFKPSRSQRQIVHRWNRFILGDNYEKEASKLRPKSKKEKKEDRTEFDLEKAVHAAEFPNLPDEPKPEHKFDITLEPDTFTEEKYTLFEQYQRLVHKEGPHEITKRGFERFLCSSPVVRSIRTIKVSASKRVQENDNPQQENGSASPKNHEDQQQKEISQPLGSYHQLYRLDGKLVALAVLDLLPRGVSSVYLIYDVAYERFGFGKLSAVREAQLARELHYYNYYMGFYIPSCAKMRYKAEYKPQWVLDFATMEWMKLEEMEKKWEKENEERQWRNGPKRKPPEGSPSAFELQLEGILDEQTVEREIEFEKGNVPICIGSGDDAVLALASDLRNWRDGRVRGALTELVATTGLEVGREAVFQFNI